MRAREKSATKRFFIENEQKHNQRKSKKKKKETRKKKRVFILLSVSSHSKKQPFLLEFPTRMSPHGGAAPLARAEDKVRGRPGKREGAVKNGERRREFFLAWEAKGKKKLIEHFSDTPFRPFTSLIVDSPCAHTIRYTHFLLLSSEFYQKTHRRRRRSRQRLGLCRCRLPRSTSSRRRSCLPPAPRART